ncbi:MAG: TraB/GumN family protein [Thermaurantimonas sp.]|uniref:TraB/GumN family protein n=1 Tax=Thermaurantimonas sp. TaxID=2681568 RepID=UPI00391D19FD
MSILEKKYTNWLYRISCTKSDKPSYIFGTMHIVCADRYQWPDGINDLLTAVEVLYLETDISPDAAHLVDFNLMDLKADTTVEMGENELEQLRAFNRQHWNFGEDELLSMHPFALLAQLQVDLFECSTMALDHQLMFQAMNLGKSVRGLESFEEHIGTIGKVPNKEYWRQLLYCITHYEEVKKGINALIDAYHTGDMEGIHRLFDEWAWVLLPSAAEKAFISDRNGRWIPVMEDAMKEGSVLFAVGAGHLLGEGGVLSLLEQKGYTVQML